jgi:hypothetical protein
MPMYGVEPSSTTGAPSHGFSVPGMPAGESMGRWVEGEGECERSRAEACTPERTATAVFSTIDMIARKAGGWEHGGWTTGW